MFDIFYIFLKVLLLTSIFDIFITKELNNDQVSDNYISKSYLANCLICCLNPSLFL